MTIPQSAVAADCFLYTREPGVGGGCGALPPFWKSAKNHPGTMVSGWLDV